MGGRHVFMGYLNDPANTAAAIDADGFICTGDVGQVDKFGLIFITGRLKVTRKTIEKLVLHYATTTFYLFFFKEILITAGGENVAPVLIENNIKAELPVISQAVVVGDRRKFLSVLLTLKVNSLSCVMDGTDATLCRFC